MKATQTIWRTVVFAGAMLGAPACHKKAANTTPSNTTQTADPMKADGTGGTAAKPDPTNATPPGDGTGDPCGGGETVRPRGTDDHGGGTGRGFVLS